MKRKMHYALKEYCQQETQCTVTYGQRVDWIKIKLKSPKGHQIKKIKKIEYNKYKKEAS